MCIRDSIYSTLPEQKRYDELFEKRTAETLTKEEHSELTILVENVEKQNVIWLSALVELSKLRGVSIEKVKEQLGMPTYPPLK